MDAQELGSDLRNSAAPFLGRRRGLLKLSLSACAAMGGIALYQTGIWKRLPGVFGRWLNAEKVHGSAEAYSIARTPDALLGLASYAVTACLAAAGSPERWKSHPWLPILMSAKIFGDAAFAAKLTSDEIRKIHAFSVWSLAVTLLAFAAVPVALPEARAALTELRKGAHG